MRAPRSHGQSSRGAGAAVAVPSPPPIAHASEALVIRTRREKRSATLTSQMQNPLARGVIRVI
jgi:hypothetical protein